jgi:hypothetical protein
LGAQDQPPGCAIVFTFKLNADSYDYLAGDGDVKVSRWFVDVRFKLLFHSYFHREQVCVDAGGMHGGFLPSGAWLVRASAASLL